MIFLFEIANFEQRCLDIETRLIVCDRLFFKAQALDARIRIMTTLVTIRDLEISKHQIDEYVIVSLYMIEKNKQENEIRTMFCREVHLVNDLKANILIDMNIMSFESIVVDSSTRIARIESCKIIVLVEIRTSNNIISKSIHLRKSIIISSRMKFLVQVHHFVVSKDRDFLFELDEISHLTSYAHLIDATIKVIILRNDTNRFVHISRNHRLSRLFEMKYFNVFHVESIDESRDFASRQSKSQHQSS